MQQYQKIFSLVAVMTAAVFTGCASRQPVAPVVVVPPVSQQQQPATVSQATSTIRSGTVVAVQDTGAVSGSVSQGSSGGVGASGTSTSEQLLTVQYDDGTRQDYRLGAGSQRFKVGDRVTVNAKQDNVLIMR